MKLTKPQYKMLSQKWQIPIATTAVRLLCLIGQRKRTSSKHYNQHLTKTYAHALESLFPQTKVTIIQKNKGRFLDSLGSLPQEGRFNLCLLRGHGALTNGESRFSISEPKKGQAMFFTPDDLATSQFGHNLKHTEHAPTLLHFGGCHSGAWAKTRPPKASLITESNAERAGWAIPLLFIDELVMGNFLSSKEEERNPFGIHRSPLNLGRLMHGQGRKISKMIRTFQCPKFHGPTLEFLPREESHDDQVRRFIQLVGFRGSLAKQVKNQLQGTALDLGPISIAYRLYEKPAAQHIFASEFLPAYIKAMQTTKLGLFDTPRETIEEAKRVLGGNTYFPGLFPLYDPDITTETSPSSLIRGLASFIFCAQMQ